MKMATLRKIAKKLRKFSTYDFVMNMSKPKRLDPEIFEIKMKALREFVEYAERRVKEAELEGKPLKK